MIDMTNDLKFLKELENVKLSKEVIEAKKVLRKTLTPVKTLTTIINRFYVDKINKAIKSDNEALLSDLLKEIIALAVVELEAGTSKKWLKEPILVFTDGNAKTGRDTVIINSSSAILCPSKGLGHCKHCKTCYAYKSEIRHIKEIATNCINSYMLLNYDIELLYHNIVNSKEFNKIKDLEFIRFNSNGDILNQNQLNKLSKLIELLKQDMANFKVCYTYTHNKTLNFDNINNIVVNYSDSKDTTVKRTIVAYKWDKKYLDTSKYVICTGNCNQCSYCKDENDKRCIVFMAHGGGLKGLEMLPDGLLDILVAQKYYDWATFYSKLINPQNKTLDDFL